MFSRPFLAFGAENETRTRDPNLGKVVLYQLSYFRIFGFDDIAIIARQRALTSFWDCKCKAKIC